MGSALDKAKKLLQKAKDESNKPGDNSEKVAEAAAEAIRAFVEVGKKEDAAEEKDLNDAAKLLNEAFAKKTSLKALNDFVKKHFDEGWKLERGAADPKKTDEQKTEAYTKAAAEYQMAAAAMARAAEVGTADAVKADQDTSTIGKTLDAWRAHCDAADAYRAAASYLDTAAKMYVNAANLEGDKPRELAEKKLEFTIASGLFAQGSEQLTKAADEHKKGKEPNKETKDKDDAKKYKQDADDCKTYADSIKLK